MAKEGISSWDRREFCKTAAAASVREATPSVARMLVTWPEAVFLVRRTRFMAWFLSGAQRARRGRAAATSPRSGASSHASPKKTPAIVAIAPAIEASSR